MKKIIQYNYLKSYKQRIAFAWVELEISLNKKSCHEILIETEKIDFTSQGNIEGGYEKWNESAKKALSVFLDNIELNTFYLIKVNQLQGRVSYDTNNAAIGVAAILGLMKYLELNEEEELLLKMKELIYENWKQEIEEIPNFEKIYSM